jgi:flavin reductase (NADH)/flavin reductase
MAQHSAAEDGLMGTGTAARAVYPDINQLVEWRANETLAGLPMVAPDVHRAALRHFAVGVTIVTARHGEEKAGLTATAVCSVTADPPRLVAFINKNVVASKLFLASGTLCVNVLAGDQEEIACVFAGMRKEVFGDARFSHGTWSKLLTGAPVLEGALASLDCRVIKVFDESTHHAFLCEVLDTRQRQAEALIYLDGGFRRVAY